MLYCFLFYSQQKKVTKEINPVTSASLVNSEPTVKPASDDTIENTEEKRDTLAEDVVTLGNGSGNEPPEIVTYSNGSGNEPPK